MKDLQTRIAEAREDLAWAQRAVTPRYEPARERAKLRALARLADLEAVRDGKAVEVDVVIHVDRHAEWAFSGTGYRVDAGERGTILRGIAYLPITTTDETEAESEVSDGE